jgi:lambda family phage portal protein
MAIQTFVGGARRPGPGPAPKTTWLDRAVEWISPKHGFDRRLYRARMAIAEEFKKRTAVGGAALNRLRTDWSNNTTSADAAVRYDRERIRNIVRELILGNSYASAAVRRIVANVVGRGITPQSHLQADTAETEPFQKPAGWRPISEAQATRFQNAAEELWGEFAETSDIAGRQTFYEQQDQVEEALTNDGEILVHLPAVEAKGRPLPFAVELIECDRLATPTAQLSSPNIRDGVEIEPTTGAPIAYHVLDYQPGDTGVAIANFGKSRRIPRFDANGWPRMLHLFRSRRPGQTRGYSDYAPCLDVFEDLHRYWEAEIVAARVAACYCGFVKSPYAGAISEAVGQPGKESGSRIEEMEPGRVWYGMPGEEMMFGNPARPNAAFGPFTEILLRAIGVCHGLPFELIALDFSKTNYSSARASLLEARRTFQSKQGFQVGRLGKPVWGLALRYGILQGRLEAPGFAARQRDYLASFWTPPSWGWVDPVKEEQAARESIRGFLSTHADELAAQGRDMDQTFEQCAREHKRLKTLGLPSPWDLVTSPKSVVEVGAGQTVHDAEET